MSRWPGVYVIGLTGNIGTGKSVVRSVVAGLGAITIDADQLAHEALYRGAAAYEPVVQAFGRGILREGGEIDRRKLAAIVFADTEKLERLEATVHPVVSQLIDARMRDVLRPDLPAEWLSAPHTWAHKDGQPIVVIEAIKLFEAGLAQASDQVWVTSAPAQQQLERLVRLRHMSEAEARARIDAQSPQLEKIARADVVLDNSGTPDELRAQVVRAWQKMIQCNGVRA